MICHEENFANQDHHHDAIWRALDEVAAKNLLKIGEEALNQVVKWLTVFVNFKLECLKDCLQSKKTTDQALFSVGLQPLLNICMQALVSPHIIVTLCDVIDNVLDA